jgi:hypothetical protein
LALPPIVPAKARAARIHSTVNHLVFPFPQSELLLSNVAVTGAKVPVSTP